MFLSFLYWDVDYILGQLILRSLVCLRSLRMVESGVLLENPIIMLSAYLNLRYTDRSHLALEFSKKNQYTRQRVCIRCALVLVQWELGFRGHLRAGPSDNPPLGPPAQVGPMSPAHPPRSDMVFLLGPKGPGGCNLNRGIQRIPGRRVLSEPRGLAT